MIKAMIVDDEKIAIAVLVEMLKKYKNIEVVGKYTNPQEALSDIAEIKPDVIFLDIHMGADNGIEMAESFLNACQEVDIIFVTAYSDYAIEAFELNAIDYLLKPIIPQRLDKAIQRIKINQNGVKKDGLYIQSFGNFIVLDKNGIPIKWRTAKSKELFAFLWSHRNKILDRSFLVETLFPERDANRATTLFSTTLYQMRKNLSGYLPSDFIKQVNKGYILNIEIDSDYQRLQDIISTNHYHLDDIDNIKNLHKNSYLEFEDYNWKENFKTELINNLKIYLLNFLGILDNRPVNQVIIEDTLIVLYDLDKTDDNIVHKIVSHYRETNQITKLKTFYQEHVSYLENEMDIKPPNYLKEILYNI